MKKVFILGTVIVLTLTALIGCGEVEEIEEEELETGTDIVKVV